MPHSTRTSFTSNTRDHKFLGENQFDQHISMEKFPDLQESSESLLKSSSSPIKQQNGYINDTRGVRVGGTWIGKHNRQKSLSDAFSTLRARSGSVTSNVHDVADALKAPVSAKLVVRNPFSSVFPR